MSNPNKMAFDLKELMNNPDAMRNIQNMIQQNLSNDITPKSEQVHKTKEEEREELRKKLRAKINQQHMKRQPKDVQMKEQMKTMQQNSSMLDNSGLDAKEMIKSMMSHNAIKDQFGGAIDSKQQKRITQEFEKFMEKEKEKKNEK
jgi:hypothetical protein